ncbi:cytochrome C and Quinol oxidase polypeptide I [bacterium BMS3Abin05]|nr:cytochrome C and Quinol oxidase polypeptide I [bacterium BMS3Abin05]GBE27055.1 cytochrome C and Quinol oxidase polypeptide I [bacterium BMS3Bbin03]
MHSIVRWYVRTSVFFLTVGLVLGVVMIIQKELGGTFPDQQLITAHTHSILVGFVILMIMGVAQWMFPRPVKGNSRYSPYLAEYIYYTMTTGVFVRTAAEIVSAFAVGVFWHWAIVVGSLLEVLALLFFFYNMWTRIRPTGSQFREAKGEKF